MSKAWGLYMETGRGPYKTAILRKEINGYSGDLAEVL